MQKNARIGGIVNMKNSKDTVKTANIRYIKNIAEFDDSG